MSDVVVVNSGYTQNVFKNTFKRISTLPEIVYPCVNVKKFDADLANLNKAEKLLPIKFFELKKMFLILNKEKSFSCL